MQTPNLCRTAVVGCRPLTFAAQPWWDADSFAVGRFLAEHRDALLQPYAAGPRAAWRADSGVPYEWAALGQELGPPSVCQASARMAPSRLSPVGSASTKGCGLSAASPGESARWAELTGDI